MRIINASGPIYEGMWSYDKPFPKFRLIELKNPEWVDSATYSQAFEGFSMLTGSYISTPGHMFGLGEKSPAHTMPLEKLFGIDAYVLKFDIDKLSMKGNKPYITYDDIRRAERKIIPDKASIIVSTGWGEKWGDKNFITHSWFFRRDAIEYLVRKKPFILAADTPSYDNVGDEEGNWGLIFGNDVSIVAPLINVEKITNFKVKMYICPLNILNTTGLPCRVIIAED